MRKVETPHAITHTLVDDLHADTANPRHIDPAELDALTHSIEEFGFVDPIIARKADGLVIGGHQRLRVARRLGLAEVPVVFVDLDNDQARLLNLALNRISGTWDEQLLSQLLVDLEAQQSDLTLSGFNDGELQKLLASLDAREQRERIETFDAVATMQQLQESSARTKRGDTWNLGSHLLLCGDATDADDVRELMAGAKARMAFTDPPYNVDYGGRERAKIENDKMSPEDWRRFVAAWSAQFMEHVDGALYICMSAKEWPVVAEQLEQTGGHWSTTIIWSKDRFTLGRSDYQRPYEPIWYGWPEGAKRHWCGDRDQGDVWSISRPTDSKQHPTMKPVVLAERAINNDSEAGDVVLDLFLGSGTTLIAAQRTGRVCFGMELSTWYCDLIVARWEAFSGEDAVQVTAGERDGGA